MDFYKEVILRFYLYHLLIGFGLFPYFLFLFVGGFLFSMTPEFKAVTGDFEYYLEGKMEGEARYACYKEHPYPAINTCIQTPADQAKEDEYSACYEKEKAQILKKLKEDNNSLLKRFSYSLTKVF